MPLEIGTKEQLNFLKGYPILAVLVISLVFNVYLNKQKDDIYKDLIIEKDRRIKTLEEANQDYRNNVLLSNQINAASKTLK